MDITYEREKLSQCEVSSYVKGVTIQRVEPADNSDNLDRVFFCEVGWQCIAQKDMYKEGDKVMLIPPDSVLPFQLGEELGITNYLSKGRVRVTRLRGNRSEGVIVPKEKVEPYLPYILKWEDPPNYRMKGDTEKASRIPIRFEKYMKMENFLNVPHIFEVGEDIWYSEKLHGTNSRFAAMVNPEIELYQYYVGSHTVVLKRTKDNLYWEAFEKYVRSNLPTDLLVFGEIFGQGIQHLHYERKEFNVLLFAAMKNGEYLTVPEFIEVCDYNGLPRVEFYKTKFESEEQLRGLSDAPSEYTSKHIREGIVVTSDSDPLKTVKVISFNYLTGKNRTERH